MFHVIEQLSISVKVPNFLTFAFLRQGPIALAGLRLTVWTKLTLNSWSHCLHLLHARTADLQTHATTSGCITSFKAPCYSIFQTLSLTNVASQVQRVLACNISFTMLQRLLLQEQKGRDRVLRDLLPRKVKVDGYRSMHHFWKGEDPLQGEEKKVESLL